MAFKPCKHIHLRSSPVGMCLIAQLQEFLLGQSSRSAARPKIRPWHQR
jgi:hypothetical protein